MSARKHRTPLLLLTAFLGAAGIAACTLNPQPLPPDDDDRLKANDPEEAPDVVNQHLLGWLDTLR